MVCSSLNPKYNSTEAEAQIESLNKAGYPAMKIECSKVKNGGYFISSFECASEDEMKKHYKSAHDNFFPYGNPLKTS